MRFGKWVLIAFRLWFWQGVNYRCRKRKVTRRGDLYVSRIAFDHAYRFSEGLHEPCVIGGISQVPFISLLKQRFFKYLGSLGFPQILAGNSLLDNLVGGYLFERTV